MTAFRKPEKASSYSEEYKKPEKACGHSEEYKKPEKACGHSDPSKIPQIETCAINSSWAKYKLLLSFLLL